MSGQFLELKDIIKRGKKESLNFGLCLTKEKGGVPAFLVHRKHTAKKLFKEAKSQSGSARGAAGTLAVAERLVTLTCQEGRATTALARGLRLYFKDNGYSHKIVLIGPDGETIDDGSEETGSSATPGRPPAGTGDPDQTGQGRDKRRDDLRKLLARLEAIVAKRFAEGSRERQSLLSLIKVRRASLADAKADLDAIQRFARDLATSLPNLAAANKGTAPDKETAVVAKGRSPAKMIDPHKTDLKQMHEVVAKMDSGLKQEAANLKTIAREVKALDRLSKLGETNRSFSSKDRSLTREAMKARLAEIDAATNRVSENELQDLLAEEKAIKALLDQGDSAISQKDIVERRHGLAAQHQERLSAFRKLKRDREVLSNLAQRRAGELQGLTDSELMDRLKELNDALARPQEYGLSPEDVAIAEREKTDTKAEAQRRLNERKQAKATHKKEIAPVLKSVLKDLQAAAEEEDITVGRRFVGNKALVKDDGTLDPEALKENSAFAKIVNLPEGPTRTAGAREYLEVWQAYDSKVSPTVEDSIWGDSKITASHYNSGLRADMRIKAAATLAEEARGIVDLMNREGADPNGEKLVRIIQQITDAGSEIRGPARKIAEKAIRKYLSMAIADVTLPAMESQSVVKALMRGEEPDPKLVEQAKANGFGGEKEGVMRQALNNARRSSANLGFLVGAIEAGQARGLDNEADRRKAEEAQAKAIFDILWSAGTAPVPGLPEGGSKTIEQLADGLKSLGLDSARDKLFGGDADDLRKELQAKLRKDTRNFRSLALNLLGVTPDNNVIIGESVKNARSRVATDRLNQPD